MPSGPFAASAEALYRAGGNVLPVVPGTKRPPLGLSWRRWAAERQSADEVAGLIARFPTHNIAVVLGQPGNLVDIETDAQRGEESLRVLRLPLPPTACWRSPRGFHRLYRAPGPVESCIGFGPALDVLAAGRYAVVPRSTGREWLTPGGVEDIAPLPEAWLEALHDHWARHRAGIEPLEAGVEEGRRNVTLASLVGSWLTRGSSECELHQRALRWAQRCHPPLPEEEAVAVVRSVLRTRRRARSPEREALLLARTLRLGEGERLVLAYLEVLRGELGVREHQEYAAPTRTVADYAGLSPSTVLDAYHRLQARGLIHVRKGRAPDGRPVFFVTPLRSVAEHKQ